MLCVRELSYNAGATHVLKNVSFELKSGENLLILGENGSGKTTLFKLLLALLPPKNGEILLFDKPLKATAAATLPQLLPTSRSTKPTPLSLAC